MFRSVFKQVIWLALFANVLGISHFVFAKENFTDLNKGAFLKSDKIRQYTTFGGGYKSDYNSREYEILAGYHYKSNRFLHEIDFLHESTSSSTTTIPMRKTEELYDLEASSRMMIKESRNYLNFYHRTKYDELSDFYYDIVNVAGVGRLFFNGRLEGSINAGRDEVKNFNSEMVMIGILKTTIPINESVKFSMRGLMLSGDTLYNEEIKTVLSFRIQKNLFFELIHKYEKNRYEDSSKKLGNYQVNHVKREAYARFKYTF